MRIGQSPLLLGDCGAAFDRVLAASTAKKARNALNDILRGFPEISIGFGRGKVYWRAQKSDANGFDPSSRMWCPPSHLARTGRLNDEGRPTLYLASQIETALCEVEAREGDYVHLVGFRVLSDQELRIAAIGELMHVQKLGYMRSTGIDPGQTFAKMLNGYEHEVALSIISIDAFLANVLSDPHARSNGYLLTRTLWGLILNRTNSMGLFYPSVKNHLGLNLAIREDAAKRVLHGVSSMVLHVKRELRFGYFDFDIVRTANGVDNSDNYIWQEPEGTKQFVLYGMCKEEYEKTHDGQNSLLNLPTHQALPPDHPGFLRKLFRRLGN